MAAGVGLGYIIALIIKRLTGRVPGASPFLILFPWRALLALAALVAISSPILLFRFGLSPEYQIATNSIVLSMMVLPWAAHYFVNAQVLPSRKFGGVIAMARTVAVLSIAITSILNFGVGFYLSYASSMGDVQKMINVFSIEGLLLLGVDILVGLCQWFVSRRSDPAA